MIEFCIDRDFQWSTDALVVEVDCVGNLISPFATLEASSRVKNGTPSLAQIIANEIEIEYRNRFNLGVIEPGHVELFERTGDRPQYVFFFPSRVHSLGPVRDEYLDSAMANLLQHALRFGIKSIAIPLLAHDKEELSTKIKFKWLSMFAKVPEIKIVLLSFLQEAKPRKQISIFTDGGAEPNPGVGGYGVVLRFGETYKELKEGFQLTSNNRMELLAAIVGLETLKEPCRVRLHSDSRYVIDAVNTGLLFRLALANWASKKAKNIDLWKRFLKVYLIHEVEMVWVKGHSGVADNERCDQLATEAIRSHQLKPDPGYEKYGKRKSTSKSPRRQTGDTPLLAPDKVPNVSAEFVASLPVGDIPRTKPKKVGDLCRKCSTPLIRKESKKHKADAAYWYEWYLYCTTCSRMYLVEEAKTKSPPK